MAVLIHGGFWRARYGLDLEHALAADLVARDPALELASVALAPEAAVDEHRHGAGVPVQLAHLGRMVPVAMQ